MTEATESDKLDPALTGIEPEAFKPSRRRILVRALLVIATVVAVAVVVPSLMIPAKKAQVIEETENRLRILAVGRSQVLTTWLEGVMRPAERVVESELFRLFATEVDQAGGDLSALPPAEQAPEDDLDQGLGVPLVEQLPFIERVLTDFVVGANFLDGYLFGRNGDPYVATAGAEPARLDQKALAMGAFERISVAHGPVRASAGGLVMDLAIPIFAVQTEPEAGEIVAVLLLAVPVGNGIADALAPRPLAPEGASHRLIQLVDDTTSLIDPGASPPVRPAEIPGFSGDQPEIPFAGRHSPVGEAQVFSFGIRVAGPSWWILEEQEASSAKAALKTFTAVAVTIAALVVMAVIVAFGAFWWHMTSAHNQSLAEQYRRLAGRISAQKRLLDSINDTIGEHIGLKSRAGLYRYVNPAFAKAVGRSTEQIIGLDDAALFGAGTAERLLTTDRHALDMNEAVTSNEEVYIGQKLHHLQISKVPYRGETAEDDGVVSVVRDVTELVEEQQKKERSIQQMVMALVRAIELRDPYLAGHSRRVAGFCVEVAQRLDAAPAEIATVEIAAQLSQIGKLKVPREILTKPERLSEAEVAEMQKHLDHAIDILKDVDFELPVVETIHQMHERLDGAGYPKGLTAAEIRLSARILGACDVFCARIEPRAYRSVISPQAALDILAQNADRYDPKVVAALREAVFSVAGEKLIAGLGQAS